MAARIDVEVLYSPLVLWAIQPWQKPLHTLHLALDTTVLWNRFCVVMVSVVCHGRAIPLLWRTLEHPSASVSAEVVIALLERANLVLARPVGIASTEPWTLVSNLDPALDLVWSYGQRFCCEQLFRDQKSGSSSWRAVVCATLIGSIGSCWWWRSPCWSAACRDLPSAWRVNAAALIRTGGAASALRASVCSGCSRPWWMPAVPCIPSRGVRRRQKQPWFTRVELPPPPRPTAQLAVA
ncbi:hypothetical protein [Synechococcus sp. CS-1328]|uniref:hypothetical protein n=1 Tax=Synechococcus sp. CS-1328 TaxID=2847976 RepID=UPI00223B7766|nr:hypothetical protein [Synechococcus sp. CS-1328]MCT0223621.1 hypothetical protein [Synechococcus sp. CS-1328]